MQNPATAAANPPTTVGVASLSPPKELPPLNQSLFFSNVTMPALQAAGIPVLSIATVPQYYAGKIHPEEEFFPAIYRGVTPTVGV